MLPGSRTQYRPRRGRIAGALGFAARAVGLLMGLFVLGVLLFVVGFGWFLWIVPNEEVAIDRMADGIVVLTGGASRTADGMELLAAGKGKRLLISPEGQCLLRTIDTDGRPVPRPHFIRAIGQAFLWQRALATKGGSLRGVGRQFGVCYTRVRALVVLTQLSPTIINAALGGALPETLTLEDLVRAAQYLDWSAQQRALGLQ